MAMSGESSDLLKESCNCAPTSDNVQSTELLAGDKVLDIEELGVQTSDGSAGPSQAGSSKKKIIRHKKRVHVQRPTNISAIRRRRPRRTASNYGLAGLDCQICFESRDDYPHVLPCDHLFHNECISKWFRQSEDCPVCLSNASNNHSGPGSRASKKRIRKLLLEERKVERPIDYLNFEKEIYEGVIRVYFS